MFPLMAYPYMFQHSSYPEPYRRASSPADLVTPDSTVPRPVVTSPYLTQPHHYFPFNLSLFGGQRKPVEIKTEKTCHKITIDVQHFSPDELVVKAVDNWLLVEGKHEEKNDEHGTVERSFQRKYQIPSDVDPDNFDEVVECEVGKDGYLVITIPRKCGDGKGKILRITTLDRKY